MAKIKKADILKITTLIRSNYDNAYADIYDEEAEMRTNMWFESLQDYDYELVYEATKNAIKVCDYAPRLSHIIKEIEKLLCADKKSDEELWAELTSVLGRTYEISRYLSYPQYSNWTNKKLNEIYEGLSDELKTYVVNVSTLIELSQLSSESLQYEKARFFKQMPVLKTHAADKKAAEKIFGQTNSVTALSEINKKE